MTSMPMSETQAFMGSNGARSLRVIVADAYAPTREVIEQVLADDRRFRVVGTAGTIDEAVRLIHEAEPDVLVVDPWLSGPAGLPACVAAKAFRPDMLLVAVLPDDREDYRRAAEAVGADAALLKRSLTRGLVPVLQEAASARGLR